MSVTYDLLDHGVMLHDRHRLGAYTSAIQAAVRPGDVVVDIGTGVGVFALAACQAGARRVYAIEPAEVVQVAREVVAANGFASRVQFVEQWSTEASLPETADVVVLDVRGVLPDDQIPIALDARRFLRAGGAMIPATDAIWMAPVSAHDTYAEHVGSWNQPVNGISVATIRHDAVNRWIKARFTPAQLMATPQHIATITYGQRESDETRGNATWTMCERVTAQGVAVWFDSILAGGVAFSNRPGARSLLYGQAFFPWPDCVTLERGDLLSVTLTGRTISGMYRWQWNTTIIRAGCDIHDVSFHQADQ
jgi:predicted O-methyltransferase YrrM